MRHIIHAQPPIIATHPTTGSNQIAPDMNECKARFVPVVEAVDGRKRLRQRVRIGEDGQAAPPQEAHRLPVPVRTR